MQTAKLNFRSVWKYIRIGIPVFLTVSLRLAGFSDAASVSADRYLKWAHEQSSIRPDPDVLFGRLPNGFRYAVKKNTTPRQRISMHLYIHAGSVHESDDQQGLAHFLEHMLFCGTTHFAPGELVKYFQRIGMKFGPDANARTGFFQTVYDILLPDSQEKTVKDGLIVMKDYAEGALLIESEVNRERKVILAEMITRDSPSYRTFVKALSFELPDSVLPKRFPIGSENVLKKAGRKDLKTFYDTWYRPELMILVMVGDFDENIAESLIKKNFSDLSSRMPAADFPDCGSVAHTGVKPFYHYEREAGNTGISIETIRKNRFSADSPERRTDALIKNMGSRIIQDRLDRLLRTPDAPFTSAAVYSQEYFSCFETYEITADAGPDKWKETLSVLEQTLRNALTHGVTVSELERVKKDFTAELDMAAEQSSTTESQTLAGQIMGSIGSDSVFQSPQQRKEFMTPLIRSATPEMIRNSLKDSWDQDHRLILVTGNLQLDGTDKSPEAQIAEVFAESQKVAVKKPEESRLAVFPYLPDPTEPGNILETKIFHDLNITQIDFENGVRLNLKPTDFEANFVKALVSFGVGRSGEPSDKPGLGDISESVINESGVGKLNKEELGEALAGANVSVVFRVNEDSFGFEGSSPTKEAALLFQLLYAYVTDAAVQENAFTLTQERFLQRYQALSQSVDGAALLHSRRFFAGGDKRFGFPSDEEIRNISSDDIREWIRKSLKNEPIEISVVGDFDKDAVISFAARYFGSPDKRQPVSVSDAPRLPAFPSNQTLNIRVKTDIKKSMVIAAYPSEDIWNISRTRRLSALSGVFSEKLRERIREELGAAYSSFAYNSPSRAYPGYGVLQAVIQVNPEDADTVAGEILIIAADLAKNGATPDEFKRAADPIITGVRDMLRTNDYWLNTVLNRSVRYPRQIEWSRTILSDYQAIKPDELTDLAKEYLNNEKSAVVIIMPEEN